MFSQVAAEYNYVFLFAYILLVFMTPSELLQHSCALKILTLCPFANICSRMVLNHSNLKRLQMTLPSLFSLLDLGLVTYRQCYLFRSASSKWASLGTQQTIQDLVLGVSF